MARPRFAFTTHSLRTPSIRTLCLVLGVAQGLVAPPAWCAWMCDDAAAPVMAEAPCHGGAMPMAPDTPSEVPTPSDDADCPACEASLATAPPLPDLGPDLGALVLTTPVVTSTARHAPTLFPVRARAPDPFPPEPIWLLTTSLRL
jgi:hypothetical protein